MIYQEQGSEGWFAQRVGKVTGSRVADALSFLKNGNESEARKKYRMELVVERLTGKYSDMQFQTPHMKWGKECEPLAASAYEAETGQFTSLVGMVDHPSIANAGASPDRLIGDDGQLEIKCLDSKNHIAILMSQEIPEEYMLQINWQLACTRREWCDFVAYDPRLPEHLQLFIKRVYRDQDVIDDLENKVLSFVRSVDEIVNKLNGIVVQNGCVKKTSQEI